jgi:hypothetical protein
MNNVELRWLTRPTMQLQYRVFADVGGPYPNYQWSEWINVPEVTEESKDDSTGDNKND